MQQTNPNFSEMKKALLPDAIAAIFMASKQRKSNDCEVTDGASFEVVDYGNLEFLK